MSHIENELASDRTTFKHFDRDWSVPNKRHLSHIRWMKAEMTAGVGTIDLMVAEAFLSPQVSQRNQQDPDQFEALVALDPDESDLHAFNAKLTQALGAGEDSGNS